LVIGFWLLEGFWNTGTLERWNAGTLERWNTGTLEHWNFGTLEQHLMYDI
jgi:hypothetical protein